MSSPPRDKQYFLRQLIEFFDPERLARVHPRFASMGILGEVREYYQTLPAEEKEAFDEAVLEWLDSESGQNNAMFVARIIKLKRAVEKILQIGEANAPLRDPTNYWRNDDASERVSTAVVALGQIGDRRAIPFLENEAAHSGDLFPLAGQTKAILALGFIDLNAALEFLPVIVRGDVRCRQKREELPPPARGPYTSSDLFALVGAHGTRIVLQIASHLRNLSPEEKRYASETWESLLARQPELVQVPAGGGPGARKAEQERLARLFAEEMGLENGPSSIKVS
ncbi:MAG: hypothetical protein WCF84_05385 [Anaerolineae bacterium]